MNKEELAQIVVEVVQSHIHSVSINKETALVEIPGFDSLVIASVLEQLEDYFAIEVPPHYIVPETFHTAGTLADVLWRSGDISQKERTEPTGL